MTSHSSATTREETSHATSTTRTTTIMNALKRRAQSVLNDASIDPQSRAILRHALEIYDPWLSAMVRRADREETNVYTGEFLPTTEASEGEWSKDRIEALTEIICRGGDESAAALFVLMGTLQNSPCPNVLANTAKHFAFTRCGELNVYGIVDTQIAALASELRGGDANQR